VDKEYSADAVRIASTSTANLYTYGIILGLFHKLDCHSSVDHQMNTALLVYSPDTMRKVLYVSSNVVLFQKTVD
jgi:hypothetical protein